MRDVHSRLHGLDALRGIAALAVALHHLGRLYGDSGPPFLPSLAVDLFFMLSGFVMTRTYEFRMREGLTTADFVTLRYKRLFAPLAIGSSIGLIWATHLFGWSVNLSLAYGFTLAFLPAFWMPNCFLLNGPAWSIFAELVSNTLHGAIFQKLSNSRLMILWVTVTLVFCWMLIAGVCRWGPGIGSILSLLPRELSCYVLGILLFRFYGDAPFGRHPALALVLFPPLLGLALLGPWVELATVLVGAPLIIRASLGLTGSKWAVWFGALSFPLYATHMPVIELSVAAGFRPMTAFALALAVALAVTMIFEARRRTWIVAAPELPIGRLLDVRDGKARTSVVYLAVSALCLALHNAVLICGFSAGLPLWGAVLLSFLVVTTTAYVLHGLFTFRGELSAGRYLRYAAAMSANIPLALVTTWFWHTAVALPMTFAAPVASTCMLLINFVLGRWAITAPQASTFAWSIKR